MKSLDEVKLYEIPEHDKINLFTRMELRFTILSSGHSLKNKQKNKIKKSGHMRMEIRS